MCARSVKTVLILMGLLVTACGGSQPTPDVNQSMVTVDKTIAAANGQDSVDVKVVVVSADGTPVANQAVVLSAPGLGLNLSTPAATDQNGETHATLTSMVASTVTITATVQFGSTALMLFNKATVTFVAPGTAARLTVVAAQATATVGTTIPLTATVFDALGAVVANQSVTFSADGTTNTFAPTTGMTDANGAFTATLTSSRAEAKTVTAQSTSLSATTPVTFTAGAPSGSLSSLTVIPVMGFADGVARSARATVHDAFGNPVTGATVTFTATNGATVVNPAMPTDVQGLASGSVSATVAGTSTLTAHVGSVSVASAQVTFAPPPDAALSTVTVSSAASPISTPVTVRVLAKDRLSAVVPFAPVTISYSGAGATITPSSGTTDATGLATFSLAATTPTSGTVKVTVAGVAITQQPSVAFTTQISLGGTVAGLTASGLVLSSPGQTDLPVPSGAGSFSFATPIPSWGPYQVTVKTSPSGLRCRASGQGLARDVSVTSVQVVCHPPFRLVAAGESFSLAIATDGSLWSWGGNYAGQLGVGDRVDRAVPSLVGTGYATVAAGWGHVLAVKTDGSLWAWGENASGELGLGDTVGRPSPVMVGTGYAAVAAGSSNSLGLKTDGSLWSWGENTYGQVGNGTTTTQKVPVQIGTGFTSAMAVGASFGAAIKTGGALWSWGDNSSGQLGLGTSVAHSTPVQVGTGFTAIAAGLSHLIALKTGGTLWAWGSATNGALGLGSPLFDHSLPTQVGTATWSSIAAGSNVSMALTQAGVLWAWGHNAWGQLGTGAQAISATPLQVMPGVASVAVTGHALALNAAGDLQVWGENGAGQLGLGDRGTATAPRQVSGTYSSVSVGDWFYLAQSTSPAGTVAWGDNSAGELGLGDLTSRPAPTGLPVSYSAISAGTGGGVVGFALALKSDGTLWGWGNDYLGEFGLGSTGTHTAPVQVATAVASMAAGLSASFVVKTDGSLWSAGYNTYGQLGAGDKVTRLALTSVGTNYASVAPGEYHALAITKTGALMATGDNSQGQCGVGPTTGLTVFTQVGTGYASAAAGGEQSLAIKTDGSLWAWGGNGYGELGLGDTTSRAAPTRVGTGTGYAALAAGENFTLLLKTDGTLWATGRNQSGQLGAGDVMDRVSAVQVGVAFKSISAIKDRAAAVRTDGTLWVWGTAASDRFAPVPGP
jgi:alpha-tubulin suppressor-like RCC1 family protein